MDFDPVALAQGGATVLVTAMATDLWTQVRRQVARLLGHGDDAAADSLEQELEESSVALRSATDDVQARDVQAELRGVLRTRLRADPELAAQFQALIEEVRAQLPATAPVVKQTATADRGSVVIQAGRDAITGR
jgi:predicted metal-dependent RNase